MEPAVPGHTNSSRVPTVRCACGKRYRVGNAPAGMELRCPNCGRTVVVTSDDLPVARDPNGLHMDTGPLPTKGRAAAGAQPSQLDSDPLLGLAYGPAVAPPAAPTPNGEHAPSPAPASDARPVQVRKTVWGAFLKDLFASFYLCGSPRNLLNIACIAAACALPQLLLMIPYLWCIVLPLIILLYVAVLLYSIQFCWRTLLRTAVGEDEIPIIQPDWSIWEDAIKPALWLLAITAFCAGPTLLVHCFAPDSPSKPTLCWTLLVGGALLWPVAVMSVALGETLLFLRPDWLLRCIIGIGPVYLVAWALLILTCVLWGAVQQLAVPANAPLPVHSLYPVVSWAVWLYFAYVEFRIMGLLFRHFRHRFPWKY